MALHHFPVKVFFLLNRLSDLGVLQKSSKVLLESGIFIRLVLVFFVSFPPLLFLGSDLVDLLILQLDYLPLGVGLGTQTILVLNDLRLTIDEELLIVPVAVDGHNLVLILWHRVVLRDVGELVDLESSDG